jgi:deoxyribodipyrimidine photo-lyase
MKNFNSSRVFFNNKKPVNQEGEYVLYWMSINRRLSYNFALEYAVAWANKLDKPLLIYEGLSCDIPWASDRFHQFLIEGMVECVEFCGENGFNNFSFVESQPQQGAGLVDELAKNACLFIADEYPVYIIKPYNRMMSRRVNVPWYTVDANGLIPMKSSEKAPYSAFIFRKNMQRLFLESYQNPPLENPLNNLKNRSSITLSHEFLNRYPKLSTTTNIPELVASLHINHEVKALEISGTRQAGLKQLEEFTRNRLLNYAEHRNDVENGAASGLSPWLHYGKISAHECVLAALEKQPSDWNTDIITFQQGKRDGFFGGHPAIGAFLDELITWRETGFHYCHQVHNYDKYESLPDWAIKTLDKHSSDPREFVYSFEDFEMARTHDPIWNAAQRQLVSEGIIHNYLRMLWGKKVLEWTEHPRIALKYLTELNNKYAIDGRDPNSYSGIFWIFGRFDRPWGPERPIYGNIRYMTSGSTAKKINLKSYLQKYSTF